MREPTRFSMWLFWARILKNFKARDCDFLAHFRGLLVSPEGRAGCERGAIKTAVENGATLSINRVFTAVSLHSASGWVDLPD